MSCSEKECRALLEKIFDTFDADKSGHLDCKELNQVLTRYYKEKNMKKDAAQIDKECKDMVLQLDTNKDGTVSKKEFVDFVVNLM